jgi:hypothetical protein
MRNGTEYFEGKKNEHYDNDGNQQVNIRVQNIDIDLHCGQRTSQNTQTTQMKEKQ